MKIEIKSEKIYEELASEYSLQDTPSVEALKSLEGESWKGRKEIDVPKVYSPVYLERRTLPVPFDYICGRFEREDYLYKGNLFFVINEYFSKIKGTDAIFDAIESKMSGAYGKNYIDFGEGRSRVLFNEEPIVEVRGRETVCDLAVLGEDGSKSRSFGDFEQFSREMMMLEKVANAYVNTGIDAAVVAGRIKTNPNVNILLLPE